jgi:hypothetical protein
VASALIVVSLGMSSVLRLRLINLAGSAVFTVYGLLIGAVPIVIANVAIAGLNVLHLARLWRTRTTTGYFEALEVPADSPVLHHFLTHWEGDIARFQPDFPGVDPGDLTVLLMRDAAPVGAVVARLDGGTAQVLLDYVTPQHRDLRAGRFFWGEAGVLRRHGVRRVVATAATREHARYLRAVGFTRDPESQRWTRDVA